MESGVAGGGIFDLLFGDTYVDTWVASALERDHCLL
jgi:hypothetical protein